MSTDRDVTRIVQSWLEGGVTALPDRVLDAVLDQVPTTPQRRHWWSARRAHGMNSTLKLGVAAAAVLAVAVVALSFMPRGGSGPGAVVDARPTATPAPSPTAAPSPSGSPSLKELPSSGDLEPGTYSINDRAYTQATHFIFTVPAGWSTEEGFLKKHEGEPEAVELSTWVVSHAYTDSCDHTSKNRFEVGTSPDALVSALVALKNREVSAPTDVTLGGFPAKRLELSVPADLDVSTCAFGAIKNWPDVGGNEGGGLCCGGPGHVDVVYVVDINGKALAVVARHLPGSSPDDLAELEAILDSVRIDP